jgi:hypothetical protein
VEEKKRKITRVGLDRRESEEMACGRDRLERSSLVRKQVKKQPIALKNDLKRNRNTFPKINPISRFNDAHIMLLSSIYFLFLLFFFFRSCGVYNQGVRGGGGEIAVGLFLKFETNQTRERFLVSEMKTFLSVSRT